MCKRNLPLKMFSLKNKKEGLYENHCKKCERKIEKAYISSKDKQRKESKKKAKENKALAREYIRNYKKKHHCVKCGESRYYLLEFHHIDDNKERNIGQISSWDLKRIQREIRKCAILCANCHKAFHWLEANHGLTFKEFLRKKF